MLWKNSNIIGKTRHLQLEVRFLVVSKNENAVLFSPPTWEKKRVKRTHINQRLVRGIMPTTQIKFNLECINFINGKNPDLVWKRNQLPKAVSHFIKSLG